MPGSSDTAWGDRRADTNLLCASAHLELTWSSRESTAFYGMRHDHPGKKRIDPCCFQQPLRETLSN